MISLELRSEKSYLHSRFLQKETILKEGGLTTGVCYRCFGIIVFLKKKSDVSSEIGEEAIFGAHIAPGKRNGKDMLRKTTKLIKGYLKYYSYWYDIYGMVVIGGKIDTPQNEWFFEEMERKIIWPLERIFPKALVHRKYPSLRTCSMNLVYQPSQEQDINITEQVYKSP